MRRKTRNHKNGKVFKSSIKIAAYVNDKILLRIISSFLNLRYLFPSVLQIFKDFLRLRTLSSSSELNILSAILQKPKSASP